MARAPMTPAVDPAATASTADGGATDDTDSTDTGDTGSDVTWLVAIGRTGAGAYVVHQGPTDEAEGGADDTDAGAGEGAGAAGGAAGGAGQDQHVDSKGAALKAAMDILDEAENSSGAPGSSEDQFAGGFGDQGAGLKHPPGAAV